MLIKTVWFHWPVARPQSARCMVTGSYHRISTAVRRCSNHIPATQTLCANDRMLHDRSFYVLLTTGGFGGGPVCGCAMQGHIAHASSQIEPNFAQNGWRSLPAHAKGLAQMSEAGVGAKTIAVSIRACWLRSNRTSGARLCEPTFVLNIDRIDQHTALISVRSAAACRPGAKKWPV